MIALQNRNTSAAGDVLFLAGGELVVSVGIVAVFFLLGKFDWRVLTGCLVGSLLTVLNFLILSVSINRAVDRVMAGQNGALSEEDAAKFGEMHSAQIQKTVKASFLFRQIMLVAVLVAVFLLDVCNVIASLVPLLFFRPILTVREIFRKKNAKT